MEKFPELKEITGYYSSGTTRALWIFIILILMTLAVIIFLIASGYIHIGSPTDNVNA
jgi:hypothetical protein